MNVLPPPRGRKHPDMSTAPVSAAKNGVPRSRCNRALLVDRSSSATARQGVFTNRSHDSSHLGLARRPLLRCPEVDIGCGANCGHHFVHQFTQARITAAFTAVVRRRVLRHVKECALRRMTSTGPKRAQCAGPPQSCEKRPRLHLRNNPASTGSSTMTLTSPVRYSRLRSVSTRPDPAQNALRW
jgi:hypothetical protein